MIEGERVRLRPMEPGDTDDVIRMRSDPAILSRLFSDEPPTPEGHLRWLQRIQEQGDRQEFIILERATDRMIGTIGLSNIEPQHHRAEYGILIGERDARGKGFALDASRLLLDYGFNKLGLHRVYLHVFADNEAAIGLYKKLGFQQEGILREHVFKGGCFRDVAVFGLMQRRAND